jgi:ATP-binding cassette, subfamily B, bacterial PglK
MKATLKKLFSFFEKKQIKSAYFLLFLMIVGVFFEALGIGLVVPLLYAITDPGIIRENLYFTEQQWLINSTDNELILIVMSLLMVTYVLKSAFMVFLSWYKFKFSFDFQTKISTDIFKKYLSQPYLFHLSADTVRLTQNLTREVNIAIFYFLIPCLTLILEILVTIGVLLLILAINPVGFITLIFLFGIPMYLFHLFTRKKIHELGKYRKDCEAERLKYIQQGLYSIKEIMILGREKYMISAFDFHTKGLALVERKENTIQALPHVFLELLAIIGLVGFVIVSQLLGKIEVAVILASLGLFLAAVFRLIPSLTRIINSWGRVKYAMPSVDAIYLESLNLSNGKIKNAQGGISFTKALTVENLSFSYTTNKDPVLLDIDMKFLFSSVTAIIGQSGSGKSTLIDILTGLLTPTKGRILADGDDIFLNIKGWQDKLGYVAPYTYISDLTLAENIALGVEKEQIDYALLDEVIRVSFLDDFVKSLEYGVDTLMGDNGNRLSSGQRQRIGIARALYKKPFILIMDEATSALDDETEKNIIEDLISMKKDRTIIFITHNAGHLQYCDSAYEIKNHGSKKIK